VLGTQHSKPLRGDPAVSCSLGASSGQLALLAATKTRGWHLPAFSAAATALAFGLVSIMAPHAPGSAGPLWGAPAIGWSVLFIGSSVVEPAGDKPLE